MENVVATIPRATVLHTEETVRTVAKKAISPACVEDQKGSPKTEWHPWCQRSQSRTRSHSRTRLNNHPGNRQDNRRHGHRGSRGYFSDRSTSRDCYKSPSRDHYRSRRNRCNSNPYYNMHYHQGSLNTLHIESLETGHIPKDGTIKTDTAHDQTLLSQYPSFQNQFITNHSPSQDSYKCRSMHGTPIISKDVFPQNQQPQHPYQR